MAAAELGRLHDYILEQSRTPQIAEGYVRRIVNACLALETFPERGTRRDDIRPGLRTVGFERRATVAFVVEDDEVTILRILYGGRDVGSLSNVSPGSAKTSLRPPQPDDRASES